MTAQSDQVLATVDGKPIHASEVDRELSQKPYFAYLLQNAESNPAILDDLRRRVLNTMVNRLILIDEAVKSGVVDEKRVKQQVEEVIAGYKGREQLDGLLKQIGSDMQSFERDLSNDLRVNQFIEAKIMKDVAISDEDARKEFDNNPAAFSKPETVRARHILIKVDKDAPEKAVKAAEDRINSIYNEVTAKDADFAAIAKDDSECPSAKAGGDLGEFTRGQMVKEFEDVAFTAKTGEISKPFRTQFGFHIVRTDAHTPARTKSFDEAKDEIKKNLLQKKRELLVQTKINEFRKTHHVSILMAPALTVTPGNS